MNISGIRGYIINLPVCFLLISAVLTGCAKVSEETLSVSSSEVETVYMTMSVPDTKSSYSETGQFAWSKSDSIAVFNGTNFSKFELISGSGTNQAVFKGELPVGMSSTYALFPYNKEHRVSSKGNIKYFFPSVQQNYMQGLNSDIPMCAVIQEVGSPASFKMAASAIRFKFSNVKDGVKSIVVTTDQPITGSSTLSFDDLSAPLLGGFDGGKSRKFIFQNPLSGTGQIIMDVPVPSLSYNAFAIDFFDEEGKIVQSINFLKSLSLECGHIKPISIDCSTTSASEDCVITVPSATSLPTLVINTPGKADVVSKDEWIDSAMYAIRNADGEMVNFGVTSIKGRGNSTWLLPKKPYALKLGKKDSIMGMLKHKRWCLLANYPDKTLIRNAAAFAIAHKCDGLAWTPDGRYVEVILNGKHIGNYYLCEQIKIDENRVNISEEEGQILTIDWTWDETFKFKSGIYSMPYMFKDPDEVDDARLSAIQNYVNAMEQSLYDDEKFAGRDYLNYLDVESLIDQWLVFEVTGLNEPNGPRSVYVYKDGDGKLFSGPVWDFDVQTFIPTRVSAYQVMGALYYKRLFEDNEFKREVRKRWERFKPSFDSVISCIDSLSSLVKASEAVDRTLWPYTTTVNNENNLTFDEAVACLKKAFIDKFTWLDTKISEFPKPSPDGDEDDDADSDTPGFTNDEGEY